jgi:hypothetical protein
MFEFSSTYRMQLGSGIDFHRIESENYDGNSGQALLAGCERRLEQLGRWRFEGVDSLVASRYPSRLTHR